ncbi:unnamed protein product [Allacma fusca]|uniref:C-type lectin domain-containing protein n=1 Tax=Allacma fusca TaxID=39272 RepID=A0A8J2PXU3_9HEXA|nr:unnamed protein product [Allacma fusca]
MQIIYLFATCFVIMGKPSFGYPICGGTTIGNYHFATKKARFEDAKQCCSLSNMEIYDVLDKNDMENFANVVSPLKKRNHKFQITFWVNGGVTAEELSLELCPTIIWSSSLDGESTFAFKTEQCVLEHVYVCRSVESGGAGNSEPEGAGKLLLKRAVPVPRAIGNEISKSKPCHLAPLKFGLYISSEQMKFPDARACCRRKGLKVLSPIWSGIKRAALKIALVSSFHNHDKEIMWSTPMDKKSCFAVTIQNDKYSRAAVPCHDSYHTMCENQGFKPDPCHHTQLLPIKMGSQSQYVLSDTEVTYMEADACCLKHGKYLIDFGTEKQSRELYSILTQKGLRYSNQSVSTFWTAGRRRIGSNSFGGVGRIFQNGPLHEFCLSAVTILGKEDFVMTDVACEQHLHFVCSASPGLSHAKANPEQVHTINKKSAIYPGRLLYSHV